MSIATGPRRFKNWLRRQPDNRVIGVRGEVAFNPIAQFLQHKVGVEFAVTETLFWRIGKSALYLIGRPRLPEWAIKLNQRLEEGEPGTGIQARTVKRLMDEITNEMKVAA